MLLEIQVMLRKDLWEMDGNKLKIGISSTPENGKANAELIQKLSKHFKVPQSNIKIIRGATSRKKLVEISN